MNLKGRSNSLDAFRGFAIVMMVLASAMLTWALPAWMSHAQTPPPEHAFNPEIVGITWVDLVFPFFLFALGVAIPFSVGSKIDRDVKKLRLLSLNLLRFFRLAFFAIFLQHIYPPTGASADHMEGVLCPVFAFISLAALFTRFPYNLSCRTRYFVESLGWLLSILMLWVCCRCYNRPFSLDRSNIIILVLANMAFFGTAIYIFTYKRHEWFRMALLPFVLAIILSESDGWQQWIANYTPASWLYKFMFLKYLCIVLPGTIVGDVFRQSLASDWRQRIGTSHLLCILLMVIALLVVNLWGLYTRHLVENVVATTAIVALVLWLTRSRDYKFWHRVVVLGTWLLMFGIFVEPFQGGIKKDPSTVSYYLVTTGLACFSLVGFDVMCEVLKLDLLIKPLVMAGRNPMIAYVSAALIVNPILHITGLYEIMNQMAAHPILAFLRGVIVTSIVVVITMFFTRIKWFWRT